MARTIDFTVEINQPEFADDVTLTGVFAVDIESDDDGTYFKVTGLRADGKRQDRDGWLWQAICVWVAADARDPIGFVRSAHASEGFPAPFNARHSRAHSSMGRAA